MDRLSNPMNMHAQRKYHPSIIAAMKMARRKMNQYYSLTDSSAAYRVAMVLHPGMKLEYFQQQDWEDAWVDTAEKLVHDEYAASYKQDNEDKDSNGSDIVS
jgi:hypothetical protein